MYTRPHQRCMNRRPKTPSPAAAVRFTACENSRSSPVGRWFRRHMPSTTTRRKLRTIRLPTVSTEVTASLWPPEKRNSGSFHIDMIVKKKKKTQRQGQPRFRSHARSRSTTFTSVLPRQRSSFSSRFPTGRRRSQSQSQASLFPNNPSPYKPTSKTLRHRLHLLRFRLLLRLGLFRAWLSAKLGPLSSQLSCHLRPPQNPSPSWPLFRSRRSKHEVEQLQRTATCGPSSAGHSGGDDKKGSMIRRLSHSTVRSLKRACSLNAERDGLREEDRRAMERLDELWRTREFHSV